MHTAVIVIGVVIFGIIIAVIVWHIYHHSKNHLERYRIMYRGKKYPLGPTIHPKSPLTKRRPLISGDSTILPISPRRMWGWGTENKDMLGYCGETCVQSVGLYYGNWISQGVANIASGGKTLIINTEADAKACNNLGFSGKFLSQTDTSYDMAGFGAFVKKNIDSGWPIILGWFEEAGDDTNYDHIMTIIGYDGDSTGVATIYWNDNYLLDTSSSPLSDLFLVRDSCGKQQDKFYQPFVYCIPDQVSGSCEAGTSCKSSDTCSCNELLVIYGNDDPKSELLEMQIFPQRQMPDGSWIQSVDEPDWGKQDGLNLPAVALRFTALINGLNSGTSYTVLRFDDYAKLTTALKSKSFPGFLASKIWAKKYVFTATATTASLDPITSSDLLASGILSNGAYFFRCVKS